MEWTKIPTDLLQTRKSDKEIVAITKYQLLWAMLEREPNDDVALRYMTSKQLQLAHDFHTAIECRVNADIKSVENLRKRQKDFYERNQTLNENSNGYTNGYSNAQTNGYTNGADKIRLEQIREDKTRLDKITSEKTRLDTFSLNTSTNNSDVHSQVMAFAKKNKLIGGE